MKKRSWRHLITEDQFWEIIESSLLKTDNSYQKQEENLNEIFKSMSFDELVGFCYHNFELYRKSYNPNLWAAPYIAMGGCSDSNFAYFRSWLISRGKKVYYDALEKPDTLITEFEKFSNCDDILTDTLYAHVTEFYEKNFNEDFGDKMTDTFEEEFIYNGELELFNEIVFDWSENDPESMRKICPRIFEKYWDSFLKSKFWDK